MIRVVKNRSPAVPLAFGSPLPLRRKVLPLEVFFGIDNSTALPNVGTRTLPPSTASYSVIGRSTRRSPANYCPQGGRRGAGARARPPPPPTAAAAAPPRRRRES